MREMLEEDFKRILNEFNFVAVRKAMLVLDWRWSMSRGDEVPTIPEMKAFVTSLFNDLVDNGYNNLSSGGFNILECDGCLWLRFILEEAEIVPELETEEEYHEGY